MKAHVVPCGPAVNESERKAIAQLKARIISVPADDEWWLLTNLAFSATHRLQSDEIDIIAIGPPGVRVIEVKHWTAAWVNRNPGLVEQEADRVTSKARKIGTTLRRQVAGLPHVDGVFLVTETAPRVRGLEGREPVRGVAFHTFNTWRGAAGFDAPNVLSVQQVRELARFLSPRNAVVPDGALKRLAGYTRLQLRTPPDEGFHRIYSATHASRQDRVLLHLYDLSASDTPKAAEKAEREWKSLQRLQQHGWAPRIVDSFQDAPGYTDEVRFFTVADPAAPSIEERAADDAWDSSARLSFARNALAALRDLHESGAGEESMVHRNLTPGTVLVKHDNTPILTGFEHARIPADVTVASDTLSKDWNPVVAPEVRTGGLGVADHRSDLYSLCASLTVLFGDREDETSLDAAEALAQGMEEVPEARVSLSDLEASLSRLAGEKEPEPPPPSARFWTEDQVVPFRGQRYRIVSRLGSGGVGTTYKVVRLDRETQGDLGTYVAKVARDEATGRRVLRACELAHSHLRHTALSTIFEVASEWKDNNFVALMTWIEGEPLDEYAGVLPILAEDLHEESGEMLALRWLRTVCEGLGVLHDNGLAHGDLSPRNLIVSGNDLVLTDYDCVTKLGARAEAPGTVPYCSPSRLEGCEVAPSDDLYALAASFFRVLFEKEPFLHDDIRSRERGLAWQDVERDEYPLLAAFLDRATDPDPERRFATTAEALAALRPARTTESPGVAASDEPDVEHGVKSATSAGAERERSERRENEVPWLMSLLQSYPGSRWGNTETRGLDSDFAASTYIETDLEQALYRAIRERRVRLVVLCGNAGDGKTALLQHLARRLDLGDPPSAERIVKGRLDDGLIVRMNLDGSASWKGRSADQLLDDFLAPFQHGPPTDDRVHLLAVNDGRLLEWIENVEERRSETPLTKDLLAFLEDDATPTSTHIRFVNLNQRSLVGGVSADVRRIDTRFLDRLVDRLYGGEQAEAVWTPCRTCLAQERCEVRRATRVFGPGSLAEEDLRNRARRRLFHTMQAVHLRGETHITVRELRAALVYILFGIHYCRDYHADEETAGIPGPQSYSERAFSPGSYGRQGEVLRELVRFDPALDAHPQVDRHLLQPPPIDDDSDLPRYEGLSLAASRRRAWFEWPEAGVERLTGDRYALDLARGRHLRDFLALAMNEDADRPRELTERLCAGISRLETLPPQALDRAGAVPLQITPRTPTETAFWVEKPIERFRLEVKLPDGGSVPERRRAATVERVAEALAISPNFDGFDDDVERAILGDLLLCFCLENSRHALGRDKQIQRVAPAHYMASWIDLPVSVGHLRFVPETIVAMLANQKGDYVEPKNAGHRTWFAVSTGYEENLLLRAFSQGMERRGPVDDRRGDRFIESDDSVGFDQLLMVRLAQRLGAAPDKLRGREGEKISNQRPIAENATKEFSEDIRRFVRSYAGFVPRHAFVDLLESCVATGMTTVFTCVVEILLKWAETGDITGRQHQRPADILVDCSNGVDIRLRGLAERSMDDLMRRIERIPVILMMLRLLDYAARDNKRIKKQSIPSRPYATAWLDLLGDLLHERHDEASFIHRQMDDYGEKLADALEDDYPEAARVLRNEGNQPNPIRRLAAALTPLLGADARSNTISMVDSTLNVERPNGLARKRKTTRGTQSTGSGRRLRDVRSLVFTDAALDYLVHLHVLPAGNKTVRRRISLREFLDTIRTRYGFHVDASPPDMAVSNELLQSNRAILERRLRDLGLLVGVNDAEAMKRLQPRFKSRAED